jgi:hypothetical protein
MMELLYLFREASRKIRHHVHYYKSSGLIQEPIQKQYVYMFSMSIIQVLVDAGVPSEDGIVIKWDFKPGSVEGSIDLYQRGSTSAGRRYFPSPRQ